VFYSCPLGLILRPKDDQPFNREQRYKLQLQKCRGECVGFSVIKPGEKDHQKATTDGDGGADFQQAAVSPIWENLTYP
jgi:hypothetical protein